MCASPSRLSLGTRLACSPIVRPLICAAIALLPVWPGAMAKPGVSLPAGNLSHEEADLEIALALSNSELSRWNPAVADFCHVGCPACGEGKACGSDLLRWDVRHPFEIRCLHCGEIFPSSRFPNLSCTKIVAPDGSAQNYSYFRGSDGWPYYMDALILNRRREWLRRNALRLAASFVSTGDLRCAAQSKAILLSFARNYDALPVHGSSGKDFHPTFFSIRPEAEPPSGVREVAGLFSGREAKGGEPYPKWSVRQGSHWYYREIPTELVLAYEQIRPVLSASVRAEIECFIRKTVNFARSFRVAQDNMTPGLSQREIFAGRAIGESEFVRGGVQRLHLLLQNRFYADGTWFEFAPSYFNQVYRSLTESAQFLPGRPGEAGGAGGMEDAMPGLAAEWARIRQSLFAMRRPDGQLATVYDTWSTVTDPAYAGKCDLPPAADMCSTLLWASGHAVLARPGKDQPVQARLHFGGKNGSHFHLDGLGLQLYALGREPYSDFGYTQTRMRPYTRTTVAHNTVVVDDRPQSTPLRSSMGGRVEMFENGGAVQFVSVSSPDSYPQTSLYRRSLVLVPAGKSVYVLDLFEVAGGRTHEWFLHGDADRDETAFLEAELPRVEGCVLNDGRPFELWANPYGQGNDLQDHRIARRFLRQGSRYRFEQGGATVVFAAESAAVGRMRTALLAEPGTELILGSMPSLRQAREVNGAMRDHETPLVVTRRHNGWGDLRSRFAAVHQPMAVDASPLRVSGNSSMVSVAGEGFTDYHFLEDREDGRVRFRGRYGFVRLDGEGKVIASSLIDGTLLSIGGVEVAALPPPICGRVVKVHGRQLILDRPVSLNRASRIYLGLPDGEVYALDVTQSGAANSVTLGREPGFEFEANRGRFQCFPGKEIRGEVEFAVRYAVHQDTSPARLLGTPVATTF